MKKVYFSHDHYARNDPKLMDLFQEMGCEGLGAYWCVVEMLHEQGGRIPIKVCDCIANALRLDTAKFDRILNAFGLFETKKGFFFSSSALKRIAHMRERSEKARSSAAIRWEKCVRNATAESVACDRNASKVKESKVKKRYIGGTFVPPTEEEIINFCKEKNISVDPFRFINHYTSNGWLVGKNKMKDWRAAVLNWSRSSFNTPAPEQPKTLLKPEQIEAIWKVK